MIRTLFLALGLGGSAAAGATAQGTVSAPAGTAPPTTAQMGTLPGRPTNRPKLPKPTTLDTHTVKMKVDPRKPIPAPTRPASRPKAMPRQ